MSALNQHFVTSFKNNCVVRPRHPETRLPLTTEESSIENGFTRNKENELTRKIQQYRLDEELERNRADLNEIDDESVKQSPNSDVTRTSVSFDQDLSNLLQDDAKFYKHLKALRHENKKTLKMLERFYQSRPKTGQQADSKNQDLVTKMKREASSDKSELFVHKVYNSITKTEDEEDSNEIMVEARDDSQFITHMRSNGNISDLSSTESEEDPRKQWPREYSHNILPDDSEDDFRGRAFSYEVIDNMWDNFTVDIYAPVEKGAKEDLPKTTKRWQPSITIPKPFQMTLREASKAKTKSKRKEKLEKELLDKKLSEEAELNKKFKARPLPATTFVGLYAEKQAIEEEKREYRKSLNKAILEATQNPFEFMKREEQKRDLRRSQSYEKIDRQLNNKPSFKAAPYPEKLFNLSLEDRIAEQEEYRKIKMEMRAQEMLANSSLPPNMRARGERYTMNKRYNRQKEGKYKNGAYQPQINHEIPDYDEMHKKFETELIRKRREKSPTICEPFNLHTAKIPSRRSRLLESREFEQASDRGRSSDRPKKQYLRRSRSSSADNRKILSGSLKDDAPPFAMTETARLRHSIKRTSMERQAKVEEEERHRLERRKRRENQLKKEVARKSIGNDLKHVLERQNKETLQRFRESEIERKKAYKKYLRGIENKVNQRPLLFEQESQTNAKRLAHRKYKEILKDAGVDDDVLESLVSNDDKIVDAESDDDTDDLLADEEEAYQSSSNPALQNSANTVVLNETDEVSEVEDLADAE